MGCFGHKLNVTNANEKLPFCGNPSSYYFPEFSLYCNGSQKGLFKDSTPDVELC